jgi:hypothetical protein
MIRLFSRSPGIDATTYAEAQALVDDGLERGLVLDLYPDDAEWLEPLLRTAGRVRDAAEAEAPSYYFEATLKAKFLAAAATRQATIPATAPVLPPAPAAFGRLRAAAAGFVVLAAAGLVSFVTLGFITADKSVPGDWNYVFKRTNEHLDYSLSSGNSKIDVQLNHTEQRVYEIRQQAEKGAVSPSDLQRLQQDVDSLTQAVSVTPPSQAQKEKLSEIRDSSVQVLSGVSQRQAALAPAVQSAIDSVNTAAVAAGLPGGVTPLPSPSPTLTSTPTAVPSSTATPTGTAATQPPPTATAPGGATGTASAPSSTATPGTPPAATPKPSGTPDSDSAH